MVSEHSDEFANDSQQQTLTKTNFNTASLFEEEEEGRPINLKLDSRMTNLEFDMAKHQEKLAKAKETLARIRLQ